MATKSKLIEELQKAVSKEPIRIRREYSTKKLMRHTKGILEFWLRRMKKK